MFYYKISKYNPQNYDNGVYQLDEWTDFSDIGKVFGDTIFSAQEYLKVEQNYISFVEKIMKETYSYSVKIVDFEDYETTSWKNEQKISVAETKLLIQDCLRNKCWCRIKGRDFCICFGFDFYIHLCCDIPYSCIEQICHEFFLFPVKMSSSLCKDQSVDKTEPIRGRFYD